MELHGIDFYSEHLSYCGDDGQLYDLMPIPFTEDAVTYVAERIRRAQDILGRRMAVENVSYYTPTDTSLSEVDFTKAVLEEADCDLLLDINNIIVNSINHRYDATEFMLAMPPERIKYFHLAGHYVEAEDLRIDTHGAAVGKQAWDLLGEAYAHFGPVPTLLERDFNFPPLEELLEEVRQIKSLQGSAAGAIAGIGTWLSQATFVTSSTRLQSTYVIRPTTRRRRTRKTAAWRFTASCSSTTCET